MLSSLSTMHSSLDLNTTSSDTSSVASSPPFTPPPVFVPDDEEPTEPLTKPRRRSRLLQQFTRIDTFKSPARLKHEADAERWQCVISEQVGNDPTAINQILDDPLMAVGVGKRRSPAAQKKQSPGARLRAVITMAARDQKRATTTYLVKPAPPNSKKKLATPPKPRWRRSPRILKQLLASREAEAAQRTERWTAAVQHNLRASNQAPAATKDAFAGVLRAGESPRTQKRISWSDDALDEFMQRRPADAPAAAAPPTSDLGALCRARRRAVLLEMGVPEHELHPSLRGYSAPRDAEGGAAPEAGDALDALLRGGGP